MTLFHPPGSRVKADTRFEGGRRLAEVLTQEGVEEDTEMVVRDWRQAHINLDQLDSSPELLVAIPGKGERWVDQRTVTAT